MNFLRLVLALMVLVSHSDAFIGRSAWDTANGTTLGTVAVYGFFGISGYLIAGSAMRNRTGRFLWQRVLRIFPGFWVCLVVTAFVFGVIAWLTTSHACPSLSCYFHARQSPWGYVYKNFFLKINQTSIAGLPRGHYTVWEWGTWNGSIWTLGYEFLCYLFLAGLAAAGLLRRRLLLLAITVILFVSIVVITINPQFGMHFCVYQNWWAMNLMRFGSVFLVGSLLYVYRDIVPDSAWLATALAALFVATLWWPDSRIPRLAFTNGSIFAAAIAYPLLWLGAHLPFQRIGSQNDYSYGVYVYAYPVQQLLAMWGVLSWGYFGYTALTVVLTALLAILSWWGVEKRCLALKQWRPNTARVRVGRSIPTDVPAAEAVAER